MAKTWSPYCDHEGLMTISKGNVIDGPFTGDHTVTLCPQCGLFTVNVGAIDHRHIVTFSLATDEIVKAAGAYRRNAEEQWKRDQKDRR